MREIELLKSLGEAWSEQREGGGWPRQRTATETAICATHRRGPLHPKQARRGGRAAAAAATPAGGPPLQPSLGLPAEALHEAALQPEEHGSGDDSDAMHVDGHDALPHPE
jgi:hypothetical protein